MILTIFLLLATAQSSASPDDSREHITPREAAGRVSRCGIGSVTVRSDAQLQSDILVATGATAVSDQQLDCIDKAARSYDVELAPSLQPRLDAIRNARWAALFKAKAREWLAAHKLLDRLPGYKPGVTDDGAFTRDIEKLCGPGASGAFQSPYGFHTLSPDWIVRQKPDAPDGGAMTCLLNVAWASGFEVGFIGNEAAAP